VIGNVPGTQQARTRGLPGGRNVMARTRRHNPRRSNAFVGLMAADRRRG
jgi:hypothetical protein